MVKNLVWFILGIAVSVTISVLYVNSTRLKVGYIDAAILFSKYKMSDDLKNDLDKIQKERTRMLDSIAGMIQMNSNGGEKNSEEQVGRLKNEYMVKKEQYGRELEQLKASYSDKVWKQLNQHAVDFGKERGYQLIFGANGQGTIMYGEDAFDLTDQLIEYSNNKYEGKKAL